MQRTRLRTCQERPVLHVSFYHSSGACLGLLLLSLALMKLILLVCLLLIVSLTLLALTFRLRARLALARSEASTLRQRLDAMSHSVSETLDGMHEELTRLDELAKRLGALTSDCSVVLQQQQATLERVASVFDALKADGQQLARQVQQVGSESSQSVRLALDGQAGLSATLMVFRSLDTPTENKEVRVLARQGRDMTYSAHIAMAGLSAVASNLEEQGSQIAQTCETQLRRVDELDDALAGIRQLAHTSAWRARQAWAASEELLREMPRLTAKM